MGTDSFPIHCGYANVNNSVYISGGLLENRPCALFMKYEYKIDKTLRLSDMHVPRNFHTLIYHNGEIYAVGGENNKTCEKYNLKELRWVRLADMSCERQHCILYIHKHYLYAFFGMGKNNLFQKSIERLNMNVGFSEWESIQYTNKSNIDLGLMGCGLTPHGDNSVIFLGGERKNKEKSDQIFIFNFDENSFELTDSTLPGKVFFIENTLIRIGKGKVGNFNYNDEFFQLEI